MVGCCSFLIKECKLWKGTLLENLYVGFKPVGFILRCDWKLRIACFW